MKRKSEFAAATVAALVAVSSLFFSVGSAPSARPASVSAVGRNAVALNAAAPSAVTVSPVAARKNAAARRGEYCVFASASVAAAPDSAAIVAELSAEAETREKAESVLEEACKRLEAGVRAADGSVSVRFVRRFGYPVIRRDGAWYCLRCMAEMRTETPALAEKIALAAEESGAARVRARYLLSPSSPAYAEALKAAAAAAEAKARAGFGAAEESGAEELRTVFRARSAEEGEVVAFIRARFGKPSNETSGEASAKKSSGENFSGEKPTAENAEERGGKAADSPVGSARSEPPTEEH